MHQNYQEEEHSPNESLPDIIYPLPPKRTRLTNQKQQPASHNMFVYFCRLYNFSTKYKSISRISQLVKIFFKKLNYFFRYTPPDENQEEDNEQTSSQSPIQPASDEGDQPSQPSVQPPPEQPDQPSQPIVQDTSEPADQPHPQALSQASQPVIRK